MEPEITSLIKHWAGLETLHISLWMSGLNADKIGPSNPIMISSWQLLKPISILHSCKQSSGEG